MVEQSHYFGGGIQSSNISPLFLGLVLLLVILLFTLSRKALLYLFLLGTILIPLSQVVVILGSHWQAERIIIAAAGLRCLTSRLVSPKQWSMPPLTSIDKGFLWWVISNCVMFTVLWGGIDAFTNRLGFAFTSLGSYFILRVLVRDSEDIDRANRVLAIICLLCGCFMLCEQVTGRNVISALAGLSDVVTIRDGKLRAQASFAHPLLAGAFGAALVPVFIGSWWRDRKSHVYAAMGILGALLMAVASMSSTSLIGIAAGIFCLSLWPIRRYMRPLRWALLASLVCVHLGMKAPVWALIARIDVTGGSSGYHRYMLVDQSIKHFGEWWLVGTKTQSSWGWDMWDSIDWYVNEATNGGLLTLVLFVGVLVCGFKSIGIARRAAVREGDRARELFTWALGAALFTNALSFLGISYFDQSFIMWSTFLVIVSTATVVPGVRREGTTISAISQEHQRVFGYP